MKIILKQSVDNLGGEGEILEVKLAMPAIISYPKDGQNRQQKQTFLQLKKKLISG